MSGRCVSVIIPVYNVVFLLESTLASVLSQDFETVEVIVVNDGSGVKESDFIKDICAVDKRVRLICQPNMGPAMARNTGIKHARGEYILFLDGDDLLLPGAISYLVATLDNAPSSIAAYASRIVSRVDEKGQITQQYLMPHKDIAVSGNILPALLQAAPILSNGSICIRREFADKITFPQHLRYGEDWVTWCHLAMLGNIVYAKDMPVACIRLHSHNMSEDFFKDPSLLFDALDAVFKDQVYITHIGKHTLAKYAMIHKYRLHTRFYTTYMKRGEFINALKYKVLSWFWGIRHTLANDEGRTIREAEII